MAVYAERADVEAYLVGDREASKTLGKLDDATVEALVERAQRAVDLVVGSAWPRDPTSGLRLDPATAIDPATGAALTTVQEAAITRATCAAVEHELLVGRELLAGAADYLTGTLIQVAPPERGIPPQLVAELAGYGLLKRSGCALPDPPHVLDEYAPACLW